MGVAKYQAKRECPITSDFMLLQETQGLGMRVQETWLGGGVFYVEPAKAKRVRP